MATSGSSSFKGTGDSLLETQSTVLSPGNKKYAVKEALKDTASSMYRPLVDDLEEEDIDAILASDDPILAEYIRDAILADVSDSDMADSDSEIVDIDSDMADSDSDMVDSDCEDIDSDDDSDSGELVDFIDLTSYHSTASRD